jgi:O-antigen ligase
VKIALERPERVFAVTAFVLLSGAVLLLARFGAEKVDAVEGDPVIQAVWAVLYLAVLAVVLLRISAVARVVRGTLALWVLIVVALASIGWAAYPSVSMRKVAALLGSTLLGVYFGVRFRPEQQVRLLGWAFALMIAASFVMALAFPTYGINHRFSEGAWQGAFLHKNELGRIMSVALMLFLVLAASLPRRTRWVALVGVAGSGLLIVLSQSKTALVVSVCLVLAYSLMALRRRLDSKLLVTVALVATVVGGGAVLSLALKAEAATTALGRDVTLTGRTALWAMLLNFISQKPWLGYGYGSFWLGRTGPSGTIIRTLRWYPGHAHNGVLDVALELGIVGVVLFAFVYVSVLKRSYGLFVRNAHPAEAWPLVLVLIITMYNITESTLLSGNSKFFWALFVSATCTAYRALQPPRQALAGVPRGAPHGRREPRGPLLPARTGYTVEPAEAAWRR